jgi:hypothetical protein
MDDNWSGGRMQDALRNCSVVSTRRLTDCGPGDWYFLNLGGKLIPLGDDKFFADGLVFALRRNAKAFDAPPEPNQHT